MQTKSQRTRTKLLEASRALYQSKGYRSTSIDDICAHIGATKGSYYYHFSSKIQSLSALLQEDIQEELAALSEEEAGSLNRLLLLCWEVVAKPEILTALLDNEDGPVLKDTVYQLFFTAVLPYVKICLADLKAKGQAYYLEENLADMVFGGYLSGMLGLIDQGCPLKDDEKQLASLCLQHLKAGRRLFEEAFHLSYGSMHIMDAKVLYRLLLPAFEKAVEEADA